MTSMLDHGVTTGLRRVLTDFALALALFWGVALAFGSGHGKAHAVPLPVMSGTTLMLPGPESMGEDARPYLASVTPANTVYSRGQPSPLQAQVLLSLAFAAILALNLAFWRHLRRVYASPRRSVWRRG
jgi:hypothetical protein